MGSKLPDFSVRSDRLELIRQLKRIIRENTDLNDALFIIKRTRPQLNKLLKKFTLDLRQPLLRFFVGSKDIDKLVLEAQKDFLKSMATFDIDASIKSRSDLVNAVKTGLSDQVNGIINEVLGRQRSKIARFKSMVDTFRVQTGGKLARGLRLINGKTIDIKEAIRRWDFFNKNFGKYDTVIFRNGTKFPIDAWASQRSITISSEINRITTSLEAANNGIYTGKVSSHGAGDSCRFHEGEIIFFSELAKKQFKSEFPEIAVSRIKTLQQLQLDRTHIFKPNCKHIVRPFPLQAMRPKRREKEFKENPQPKIPRKINERKLIAQAEKESK